MCGTIHGAEDAEEISYKVASHGKNQEIVNQKINNKII